MNNIQYIISPHYGPAWKGHMLDRTSGLTSATVYHDEPREIIEQLHYHKGVDLHSDTAPMAKYTALRLILYGPLPLIEHTVKAYAVRYHSRAHSPAILVGTAYDTPIFICRNSKCDINYVSRVEETLISLGFTNLLTPAGLRAIIKLQQ